MGVQQVHVNIEEIRKPEIDAQLIADSIAQQLEKRIMFRRAMKRAMQNAMRLGAQGIKIMSAGPPERHRDRAHRVVPRRPRAAAHAARRHRLRLLREAKTTYGVIGVKVWVYKGEIVRQGRSARRRAALAPAATPQPEAPAEPKRAKKPAPQAGAERGGPPRPTRRTATRRPPPRRRAKTAVKKPKKVVAKADGGGEKKE